MEERSSPLFSQLVLWILFAVLVAISIFTVLIPAISSDEPEDEEASEAG